MSLSFVKAESCGNDFVLIAKSEAPQGDLEISALAQAICNRHRGVGADGLVLYGIDPLTMTLVNQDGSVAEISGNGLICLAAQFVRAGHTPQATFQVQTGAGVLSMELLGQEEHRYHFRANMGRPRLKSQNVPFVLDPPAETVVGEPLEVDGTEFAVTALSMGNPHCVVFTEALDRDELLHYGPLFEKHPRFPEGTNFEIVQIVDRRTIKMRVWERGACETEASGSGSAASAVASILNGRVDDKVSVLCPGGVLEVEWRDRGNLFLFGEAAIIAEGSFEGDWKTGQ